MAQGRPATPKEIARVAAVVGGDAARWAFTQWALRDRGRAKFATADKMVFTREGLEMASAEPVATVHARLLGGPSPQGLRFIDATCGIGADTLALARLGPTTACDLDAAHAEATRHNLVVHGLVADVRVVDSLTLDWSSSAVLVDPQRRTGQGRTLDPALFSPPLDVVVAKCRTARRALVKTSPLLPDPVLGQGDGLVFVSHGGECGEALMLFGCGVGRRAHHVESGAWLDAAELAGTVVDPDVFLFEADPAAVRAHALGAFGLPGLGDSNGYLTGPELLTSPWLTPFRVCWHGPFREDKLREAARGLGLDVNVVKKRGVEVEPRKLVRRLSARGGSPGVALLYPVGKAVRAVLATRTA